MKSISYRFLTVIAASYLCASIAQALVIDAQTNIFLASTNGGGDGLTPTAFSFAAGPGQVVSFSSVTGLTDCFNSAPGTNADGFGGACSFSGTDINSSGGIAGIVAPTEMFLAGVFIDSTNPPTIGAPARLDYTGGGPSISDMSYSMLLDQVFFIGDGLTGNGVGSIQDFLVPLQADTLFLGFLDGNFFAGDPDFYHDNSGELEVAFSIRAVPAPATIALFSLGLAGLGWSRRKKT